MIRILMLLACLVTLACSAERRLERIEDATEELGQYACQLCACAQAAQAVRRAMSLPPSQTIPAPPQPAEPPAAATSAPSESLAEPFALPPPRPDPDPDSIKPPSASGPTEPQPAAGGGDTDQASL
jgi:hypothetical protein